MPLKRKVDGCGFQNLEYECEGNEVVKMWCMVCRDFYSRESQQSTTGTDLGFSKGGE